MASRIVWKLSKETAASSCLMNSELVRDKREASWEAPEMVRRYAHLSPEHLREYVEKLAVPRVVDDYGTISAQPEK